MDGTDFSMLLRKRLNYVENDTYNLGMEKKRMKAVNIYFAYRLFLGFVPCLLLLLLEEKTKKAKRCHSFRSWKLKFSKHFHLRHIFYYEISYQPT